MNLKCLVAAHETRYYEEFKRILIYSHNVKYTRKPNSVLKYMKKLYLIRIRIASTSRRQRCNVIVFFFRFNSMSYYYYVTIFVWTLIFYLFKRNPKVVENPHHTEKFCRERFNITTMQIRRVSMDILWQKMW